MSLYDREYYRQEQRGWPGSPQGTGLSATTWLIVANIAMFFITYVVVTPGRPESPMSQWWIDNLFLHPYDVFGKGKVWQLVTCTFLHGGPLHLALNMFGLWMFGRGLEALYGRREFLAFYLEAGIAASLLFVVSSALRRDPTPALGASGSVFGVIALCALRFPRTLVYVWGIIPMRLWQLAILIIGTTLWAMIQGENGGVAHAAHLGGAMYGGAFWILDLRYARIADALRGSWRRRSSSAPGAWPPEDAGLDAEERELRLRVDALLDKISRNGLASLSDEERDFLNDASRRFRS